MFIAMLRILRLGNRGSWSVKLWFLTDFSFKKVQGKCWVGMMTKWVLYAAFLMCFLVPGSPVQEHTPISSEQINVQRFFPVSKSLNVFKYIHRNQFHSA